MRSTLIAPEGPLKVLASLVLSKNPSGAIKVDRTLNSNHYIYYIVIEYAKNQKAGFFFKNSPSLMNNLMKIKGSKKCVPI